MYDLMKQVEQEIQNDPILARMAKQEELILDTTELILEKMEEQGIDKKQLALRLGKSDRTLRELFRGSRAMDLRTLSDIFFELGYDIIVDAFHKK